MSDEIADLILNMLRAIRSKQDEHDRKFDEVITRLGALERDFAGVKVDLPGCRCGWSLPTSGPLRGPRT